jgi:diguanylate cyclase (GGDEF)-like protein
VKDHAPRFRISRLSSFALLSAAVILLLGTVTARYLVHQIAERELQHATATAEWLARLGVQPRVDGVDGRLRVSRGEAQALDRLLGDRSVVGPDVARIDVLDARGAVRYSTDSALVDAAAAGQTMPRPALRSVLGGHENATVIHSSADTSSPDGRLVKRWGDILRVAVPITSHGRAPVGVLVVNSRYAPMAATISHETTQLYLALLLGLSLVYAILLLNQSSAKLRLQAVSLRRLAHDTEYLAHHDGLTGLPNRVLLRDRLHQAIMLHKRNQETFAIFHLDLDRFKEVNDTLGHFSGDQLLREVAHRLQKTLRESDTVARLGGDEFAVLLPAVDLEGAVVAAEKVLKALQRPFIIQSLTLQVDVSIGIALYPTHGRDFDELMQHADSVMYLAKRKRSGYESDRDVDGAESRANRLGLAAELRVAIDRGELRLHYQPRVSLATGEIVGVEALVRWQHPERGAISPDEFIPLAEQGGLIRTLTLWVIDEALGQCRRWLDLGIDLPVSVNLSTRDLIDQQLPEVIGEALERTAVSAEMLEVEITESVIMADPVRAREVLSRLRETGVHASIDDFGTGYSSLGYLKRLPVDQLKIDRSFVFNMTSDDQDEIIVQSTIDLAHNLGLTVVAEGVETVETLNRLRQLGCDSVQGFVISRPLPPEQIVVWLGQFGRTAAA